MELNNARLWVDGVPVEPEALQQVRNMAALPILAGHVAVMPDVHLGKGATVGTVIPTRRAVIPAAVGVDIGCGLCAVQTTLTAADLPESLQAVRARIEQCVPVGFEMRRDAPDVGREGSEGAAVHRRLKTLQARLETLRILDRVGRFDRMRTWRQIGTLGGGNHFIELCLDEAQRVWVMLHSGSRNVGKTIGEAAIATAREQAVRRKANLPDRDLAWLDQGSAEFDEYVEALLWAQDYARANRDVMMLYVLQALREALGRDFGVIGQAVNCHHNYTEPAPELGEGVWLTRKGAVSARAGQMGIVPGSMGTRSYIVRGKGNPASYCSCSHGAGRAMSRSRAGKLFTAADLRRQTEGVECRKDTGVVDEIPAAYKDIDAVMAAQSDLVEVAHTLKQVLCVKG